MDVVWHIEIVFCYRNNVEIFQSAVKGIYIPWETRTFDSLSIPVLLGLPDSSTGTWCVCWKGCCIARSVHCMLCLSVPLDVDGAVLCFIFLNNVSTESFACSFW